MAQMEAGESPKDRKEAIIGRISIVVLGLSLALIHSLSSFKYIDNLIYLNVTMKISPLLLDDNISFLKYLPFNISLVPKKVLSTFYSELNERVLKTPINPHTKRHVAMFSIINLKHFELAANLLCSLKKSRLDPNALIFITLENHSYVQFLKSDFPMILFDIENIFIDWAKICQFKVAILDLIAKMGAEALYLDDDIAFYNSNVSRYLYIPQTFDVGVFHESSDVRFSNPNYNYGLVNTGFVRVFPSPGTFELMPLWAKLNQGEKNQKINDQPLFQTYMNSLQCSHIRDGYWNCHLHKFNFIFYVFDFYDHSQSCELGGESRLYQHKVSGVHPTVMHYICLWGVANKFRFLDQSGLWVFDIDNYKCIDDGYIRWKEFWDKVIRAPKTTLFCIINKSIPTRNYEGREFGGSIHSTKEKTVSYPIIYDLKQWFNPNSQTLN